jgi:hypothetical protein
MNKKTAEKQMDDIRQQDIEALKIESSLNMVIKFIFNKTKKQIDYLLINAGVSPILLFLKICKNPSRMSYKKV